QINTKPLDEDTSDHASSLSKEDSGDELEVSPVGRIQILVHDLQMYSFSELQNSTTNFSLQMKLGDGEFWGDSPSPSIVDAPLMIAVKRLYHFKIQHRVNEKAPNSTFIS
ncbi:hypothetical protein R6Q57_005749, partial [Mikania cordata]